MSWVSIHPEHEQDFKRLGLETAADFLCLQGVILGGHPDRHVRRVELLREWGPPLVAYLKREHRVRLRDRLASVWAGLGWSSKSAREARILQEAARAGIGCPRVLAFGEETGQAFLLVAHLDMADLRKYSKAFPRQRRQVAKALGKELARIHAAGFQHPEVYAKHVLVRQDEDGHQFAFLDWQMASAQRRLTPSQRCRDLAALHATLADELVGPADRLACLRVYHQHANVKLPPLNKMARAVEGLSKNLLNKRRIRELRQLPLPHLAQNLIWLDGERLCVTLEFSKELAGEVPAWLQMPSMPRAWPCVQERDIHHAGRTLHLTHRWFTPPAAWSLPGLKRTTFPSPEFEQVAALVRLQRFRVRCPRLLALGHRDVSGGKYSFLLLEPVEDARPLEELPSESTWSDCFFPQLGRFLRCVHEAGYALKHSPFALAPHWAVLDEWDEEGELVFLRTDGLERSETPFPERLAQDLRWVLDGAGAWPDEAIMSRLVHAYVGRKRWTAEAAALLTRLTDQLGTAERQAV